MPKPKPKHKPGNPGKPIIYTDTISVGISGYMNFVFEVHAINASRYVRNDFLRNLQFIHFNSYPDYTILATINAVVHHTKIPQMDRSQAMRKTILNESTAHLPLDSVTHSKITISLWGIICVFRSTAQFTAMLCWLAPRYTKIFMDECFLCCCTQNTSLWSKIHQWCLLSFELMERNNFK